MIERWKVKTSSNPLTVDLYTQEELRRERALERERLRNIDNMKMSIVSNMIGKDTDDVVTPRKLKSLDSQVKLSLALRTMKLDEQVIGQETIILNEQLNQQLITIIDRFPPLEMVNQNRFPNTESMSTLRNSLKTSIAQANKLKTTTSASLMSPLKRSGSNVFTVDTNHTQSSYDPYVSPTKQAQTIEEDISMQFKQIATTPLLSLPMSGRKP